MALKKKSYGLRSFFVVVGLLIAAIIATYVAVNGGIGGFSTRAAKPFNCHVLDNREVLCKTKNLCVWLKDPFRPKKGVCASKVKDLSKHSRCDTTGNVCCTNATTGVGYCNANVTCNPTSYTCVVLTVGANLGQEKGAKGICSMKYTGATCKWKSDCKNGAPKLGYCKGPMEWQCCVPNN